MNSAPVRNECQALGLQNDSKEVKMTVAEMSGTHNSLYRKQSGNVLSMA